MKNIVIAVLGALMLFFILVVVFSIGIIFYSEEPELTEMGEDGTVPMVPREELLLMTQARDSLFLEIGGMEKEVASANTRLDSIQTVVIYRDATIKTLEEQVQTEKSAYADLETTGANATLMAKTFSTMKVAELTPIVARLSDDVVLDIYNKTSSRSRKTLLNALGDERAAALTERVVKQKGD